MLENPCISIYSTFFQRSVKMIERILEEGITDNQQERLLKNIL